MSMGENHCSHPDRVGFTDRQSVVTATDSPDRANTLTSVLMTGKSVTVQERTLIHRMNAHRV